MATVITVVVLVLIAAGFVAFVVRNRSHPVAPAVAAKPALEPPAPMIDLETALNQATDRTGRNMRERIEAGSSIDDLRVPDDTGPVLRRALDHVEHTGHQTAAEPPPLDEQSSPEPPSAPTA